MKQMEQLKQAAGITEPEARKMIEKFREAFPGILGRVQSPSSLLREAIAKVCDASFQDGVKMRMRPSHELSEAIRELGGMMSRDGESPEKRGPAEFVEAFNRQVKEQGEELLKAYLAAYCDLTSLSPDQVQLVMTTEPGRTSYRFVPVD